MEDEKYHKIVNNQDKASKAEVIYAWLRYCQEDKQESAFHRGRKVLDIFIEEAAKIDNELNH